MDDLSIQGIFDDFLQLVIVHFQPSCCVASLCVGQAPRLTSAVYTQIHGSMVYPCVIMQPLLSLPPFLSQIQVTPSSFLSFCRFSMSIKIFYQFGRLYRYISGKNYIFSKREAYTVLKTLETYFKSRKKKGVTFVMLHTEKLKTRFFVCRAQGSPKSGRRR